MSKRSYTKGANRSGGGWGGGWQSERELASDFEMREVDGRWQVDLDAPRPRKQRGGFRKPALPEKQMIEVYCSGCGHRATVAFPRGTAPRVRCTKCRKSGPITDFVRPIGRA